MATKKRQSIKPKSDKIWNIYHPELFDKIEPSLDDRNKKPFKVKGIQYYNFKRDTAIRTGRYLILQNFLQEVQFRMSLDRLKEYIKKITAAIDLTQGQINLGNALELLSHMKHLTELAFEPDTMYRLASVIYFDDTEDLRTWDKKHNEEKIAAWKENGTLDFFYSKPFSELTGLNGISETAIRDYLDKVADLTQKYSSAIQSL